VFHGAATLDAKFVSVEDGEGTFDLVVKISSLVPGKRITIPTRHTAMTRKWLACGEFIQGCSLSEDRLTLWVDIQDQEPRTTGSKIGVDLGMNKLISDSDGNHYGREFKAIRDKLARRQPGSKGRLRASRERENYINRTINLLPWCCMMLVGVEALHDMKRGKSRKRGKTFRKAVAPWIYRRVLDRIGHKAQENRVRLLAVPPAYTSQKCPACGRCDPLNRHGENFCCVECGHAADADTVGATNILVRTLTTIGSVESPMLKSTVQ
jgi:transposase